MDIDALYEIKCLMCDNYIFSVGINRPGNSLKWFYTSINALAYLWKLIELIYALVFSKQLGNAN